MVAPAVALQIGFVATMPVPELQSVLDPHLQVEADVSPEVKTPTAFRQEGSVLPKVQPVELPHLHVPASHTFEVAVQVTLAHESNV